MVRGLVRAAETARETEAWTTAFRLHHRGLALTLYLDSSALVKLFVLEEASDEIETEIAGRRLLAASPLSYVESGAAIGRAAREGRGTARQTVELLAELEEAWRRIVVVELDERVAGSAVRISNDRGLRAPDAIHLASALTFAKDATSVVTFACFDRRLWEAAGELGLERAPPSSP